MLPIPITMFCLALVLLPVPKQEQALKQPGRSAENKRLAFMVGDWETEHRIEGKKVGTGVASIEWTVGGMWLTHRFHGKRLSGEKFAMTHLMNYSGARKQYSCVMIDSFGGEPGVFAGNWVDDKTLQFVCKFQEEDGSESYQRFTIAMISGDAFRFDRAFSDDGQTYHRELIGTYKRKGVDSVRPKRQ